MLCYQLTHARTHTHTHTLSTVGHFADNVICSHAVLLLRSLCNPDLRRLLAAHLCGSEGEAVCSFWPKLCHYMCEAILFSTYKIMPRLPAVSLTCSGFISALSHILHPYAGTSGLDISFFSSFSFLGVFLCTGDPYSDKGAQGDAFKTLFVARIVRFLVCLCFVFFAPQHPIGGLTAHVACSDIAVASRGESQTEKK